MTTVPIGTLVVGRRFTWAQDGCCCEGYVTGRSPRGLITILIDKMCSHQGHAASGAPYVSNAWSDRLVLVSDFMDAMERIEA